MTSNLLAAAISTGALLFYVYVYTLRLKRTTSQNIVIGGAAGAAPVLVGWAAVTGDLSTPAWAMFAVVFAWTPPHFWALAVRYRTTTPLPASRCSRSSPRSSPPPARWPCIRA
jgi:heme o synthase